MMPKEVKGLAESRMVGVGGEEVCEGGGSGSAGAGQDLTILQRRRGQGRRDAASPQRRQWQKTGMVGSQEESRMYAS